MIECIALSLSSILLIVLLYLWWYDNHKWVVEFNDSKFYFKTKEKAEKFVALERELWVSVIETKEELKKLKEEYKEIKNE